MRISRSLALATLVGIAFLSANSRPLLERDRRSYTTPDEGRAGAKLDDAFVYDVVAGVFAYVIGFPTGVSKRDGVLPRFFVPDVLARQDAAIPTAIEAVIHAGEINLSVRLWKRALVVTAVILLLMGGAVVALARLSGVVIG